MNTIICLMMKKNDVKRGGVVTTALLFRDFYKYYYEKIIFSKEEIIMKTKIAIMLGVGIACASSFICGGIAGYSRGEEKGKRKKSEWESSFDRQRGFNEGFVCGVRSRDSLEEVKAINDKFEQSLLDIINDIDNELNIDYDDSDEE